MQVEGMWHHRRADDANREHEGLRAGDLRQYRMQSGGPPIDGRDEHFDEVA